MIVVCKSCLPKWLDTCGSPMSLYGMAECAVCAKDFPQWDTFYVNGTLADVKFARWWDKYLDESGVCR